MEIVKIDDLVRNERKRRHIVESMVMGKIFIYPTDTIYGIGCNAMDSDVVKRVRAIKSSSQPFSVIVPSKGWIKQYMVTKGKFLNRLPGPYTLVYKKRNPDFLNIVSDSDSLGIRIPKHFFSELVCEAGIPFVTTSVNVSGQQHVTNVDEIPETIKNSVDFIVDAGQLNDNPSRIIDLTSDQPKILRQ